MDEDEDEDVESKERDEVGRMSLDEFAELVSDAMSVALQPYLEAVKEANRQVQSLQSAVNKRTKESHETPPCAKDQ
jgi:hypothetical protein